MRLSWNEIRTRAADFAREWADETYEKGETQSFYNEFFDIFGVRRRTVARYEEHVQRLDNTSGFIDLFWPGILLVEQKSAGRDLAAARDQAGTYFDALSERDRPRYQLLSDFQTFELLDRDEGEETRFLLSDLPQHVEKFGFHHRRAAPDVPRPGSGQHRRVRVDRATARCTEGVRLRGSRPRVVPGTDRLLPVRRRHRDLRAARHLPPVHRGTDGSRRRGPRRVAHAALRGLEHASQPAAAGARRGSGRFPARERRAVRRPSSGRCSSRSWSPPTGEPRGHTTRPKRTS